MRHISSKANLKVIMNIFRSEPYKIVTYLHFLHSHTHISYSIYLDKYTYLFPSSLFSPYLPCRHKSPAVQLETFQIFKIFVANPKKPDEIIWTLYRNKSKLIAYLKDFHLDENDPFFVDEKRLLIDTLERLTEPKS